MKYMIFDTFEQNFIHMSETLEDAQAYIQTINNEDIVIYRIDRTYTPIVTHVYDWTYTDK